MADYQPIPCVQHERLEFAVLRRQRLFMRWQAEDGEVLEALVQALDVNTRNQAEWLHLRELEGMHAGRESELRLDAIRYFEVR